MRARSKSCWRRDCERSQIGRRRGNLALSTRFDQPTDFRYTTGDKHLPQRRRSWLPEQWIFFHLDRESLKVSRAQGLLRDSRIVGGSDTHRFKQPGVAIATGGEVKFGCPRSATAAVFKREVTEERIEWFGLEPCRSAIRGKSGVRNSGREWNGKMEWREKECEESHDSWNNNWSRRATQSVSSLQVSFPPPRNAERHQAPFWLILSFAPPEDYEDLRRIDEVGMDTTTPPPPSTSSKESESLLSFPLLSCPHRGTRYVLPYIVINTCMKFSFDCSRKQSPNPVFFSANPIFSVLLFSSCHQITLILAFTNRLPEKRGRHGVVLKQDNHSLMLEGVKAPVPGGLEGARWDPIMIPDRPAVEEVTRDPEKPAEKGGRMKVRPGLWWSLSGPNYCDDWDEVLITVSHRS